MPVRQHSIVEDARYDYLRRANTIENDVPAASDPTQAGTNLVAYAPQSRIPRERPAAFVEFVQVLSGLVDSPSFDRVAGDLKQVRLGAAREADRHGLAARFRETQFPPHAGEHVAAGNTTRVAFIDGGSQSGQFGFAQLILTLQRSQGGADHFAHVAVASALYFALDEAVQFIRQIDVSGRHRP